MLRAPVDRQIVLSGDVRWRGGRRAWSLAVDQHPFAVALGDSAEDGVSAVGVASSTAARLPAEHRPLRRCASSFQDAVLVELDRMRHIEIDATARRAHMQAGVISDPMTQDGER